MAVPPPLFDIFEGDVGGKAGSELPDGRGSFGMVIQVCPAEAEKFQQAVDFDPCRKRIVIGLFREKSRPRNPPGPPAR